MNKVFNSRFIYLTLFILLLGGLILDIKLPTTKINSAQTSFELIDSLNSDYQGSQKFALIGMEYGPGTQAENDVQARVVIEHLFRKKVPIIFFTGYPLAEKFVINTPLEVQDIINQKDPLLDIQYGKDWISLGYRPGGALFIQALSQTENLTDFLGKDYNGKNVSAYQKFATLKNLKDFILVAHFSGLSGLLNTYIQFLNYKGSIPTMIHGCTSISIPEAFIFLESGQLKGLLEGVAGAAWYAKLLKDKYQNIDISLAQKANSTLGIGQIFILILIIVGNILEYFFKIK